MTNTNKYKNQIMIEIEKLDYNITNKIKRHILLKQFDFNHFVCWTANFEQDFKIKLAPREQFQNGGRLSSRLPEFSSWRWV